MRYIAFFPVILFFSFFCGCEKKDLPEPNILNSSNTNYLQQGPVADLTAPCAAELETNVVSYSVFSDGGYSMGFSPTVNDGYYGLEISCVAAASYNTIKITLPSRGTFVGKVKYDVKNTYASSTVALITHKIGSTYYASYYYGYEGSIYAEYTKSQIILSFCDVKVKESGSYEHTITGKVIIPNNN